VEEGEVVSAVLLVPPVISGEEEVVGAVGGEHVVVEAVDSTAVAVAAVEVAAAGKTVAVAERTGQTAAVGGTMRFAVVGRTHTVEGKSKLVAGVDTLAVAVAAVEGGSLEREGRQLYESRTIM
jgi:hypothetical protein